jgi:hypothetical protein
LRVPTSCCFIRPSVERGEGSWTRRCAKRPGGYRRRSSTGAIPNAPPGAFSDLHYDILDEIVEGDLVVHRARGTGTNDGELMGIPASGKRAEWDEIHISRMAPDGRIAEHWGLVDTPAIMMAIGAMPAPPAAG